MIKLTETIGRLTIRLEAQPIGSDWSVVVYGGDRPHIGAVALASPENGCSLICLPDHREGELAKELAATLANRVNAAVCVSCGIHLENITKDEISLVHTIIENFTLELHSVSAAVLHGFEPN